MILEETRESLKCINGSDKAVSDFASENVPENGVLKMFKPGVITILDPKAEKTKSNREYQSTDLIVRPVEMKEHNDDEWYPPTPPLYDVTDKLRYQLQI